jgi:hypothetical protein
MEAKNLLLRPYSVLFEHLDLVFYNCVIKVLKGTKSVELSLPVFLCLRDSYSYSILSLVGNLCWYLKFALVLVVVSCGVLVLW